MQIKFFIFFTILGFLISLLCGVSVGNKFLYVLMTSALSSILFGGLGFIIYMFLEKNIPELIEALSGEVSYSPSSEPTTFFEEEPIEKKGTNFNASISDSIGTTTSYKTSTSDELPKVDTYSKPASKKQENFGDHIVIDNITIKNEPKLMAEAVRTMMSQDEDNK